MYILMLTFTAYVFVMEWHLLYLIEYDIVFKLLRPTSVSTLFNTLPHVQQILLCYHPSIHPSIHPSLFVR